MKTAYRDTVDHALLDAGVAGEVSIRPRYSGRAMYGAECFGLVGDGHDLELALSELPRNVRESARWDSMGRRSIVYFPGHLLDREDDLEG